MEQLSTLFLFISLISYIYYIISSDKKVYYYMAIYTLLFSAYLKFFF